MTGSEPSDRPRGADEGREPRPATSARPARPTGSASPRREPNYRMRRFVAIGVLAVVAVVAVVLVVRSVRKEDAPAEAFSLADAAANAADAELVDYDVTILVGDEVITTASGMIDLRTGSTYLRVSSSIGETSASTDVPEIEAASTTIASTSSTPVSVSSGPTSTAATVAGATGTTVAAAGTTLVAGAADTAIVATAPAGTTADTLDAPVVPDGVAAIDEATEVSRYVDASEQVVYVSSGAFAAAGLDFERPWVRIDLRRLGDGVTVDLDQLAGLAGGDPLDVAPLLGEATDVREIDGEAEVVGDPVKRYRVVLAGDDVAGVAPAIADQLEQLDAAVPDTFTFVVAVDAENRIRRLTYEVSNGERTVTTDIVLRVVREDTAIEFPDEADTIDFGDIVR